MSNVDANLGLNFNLGTGFQNSNSNSLFGGSGMNMPAGGGGSDSIIQMEEQMLQIMMQMMQLLEQLEQQQGGGQGQGSGGGSNGGSGSGGGSCGGGNGGSPSFPMNPDPLTPASNEQYFQSATASSWGDPHQSFNGTQGYGSSPTSMSGNANDMGSQNDLIDANGSMLGGYQVSTQTTAPNASGITYNASGSIAMNNGETTVSMGQGGAVSIMDEGKNVQLAAGQSVTLSNGATVAEASNGTVSVTDQNNSGGQISTQLSWNGTGVDVHASATDCELGGFDVGLSQPPQQSMIG